MNKLFWGFFFIFLNFNIDFDTIRVGLIPAFVGYLLLFSGLAELSEESPRFEKIRPFCIVMAVYTGFLWVGDLFGLSLTAPPVVLVLLSVASAVLSYYISFCIVWGIGDIEASNRYPLGAERLKKCWFALIILHTLSLLCAYMQMAGIVFLGLVCGLVALICFLCFFYRTKNNYLAMKKQQASESRIENEWNGDGNDYR